MQIEYRDTLPEANQFYLLFQTTGWSVSMRLSSEDLNKAIQNSWYMVGAFDNDKLVGYGRIISDGYYQTFIGDMIVHPKYQGKGIGSNILKLLLDKCKQENIPWVQLSCAKGKADFYKKFGFQSRPSDAPGMQLYL